MGTLPGHRRLDHTPPLHYNPQGPSSPLLGSVCWTSEVEVQGTWKLGQRLRSKGAERGPGDGLAGISRARASWRSDQAAGREPENGRGEFNRRHSGGLARAWESRCFNVRMIWSKAHREGTHAGHQHRVSPQSAACPSFLLEALSP